MTHPHHVLFFSANNNNKPMKEVDKEKELRGTVDISNICLPDDLPDLI